MAVRTEAVGKTYAPVPYAVGREKVKEFALATGETEPLHLDHQAARRAGHRDVVAPPMFAVVYAGAAVGPLFLDPELDINFSLLVHGGQQFRWGPLVVAGDELETVVRVASIEARAGNGFYVFETVSTNQDGHTVCVGTWTHVVRGV